MSGRKWLRQLVCLTGVVFVTPGLSAGWQFDAHAASTQLDLATGGFASETLQSMYSSQWRFEVVGGQFTEPIDTLSALTNPAGTHSPALLPVVPAAISMTLCGFLCISFVRDRRAWLAVARALLSLTHAGIYALPQLGHKLCSRMAAAKQSTAKFNPALAPNSFERTGNQTTIRYIGLLRRLQGIPDGIRTTIFDDGRQIPAAACKSGIAGTSALSARSYRYASAAHFAVASRWNHFKDVDRCPADAAEQFTCFQPAFIFSNLSRGPPAIEVRVFPTQAQRAASRIVL